MNKYFLLFTFIIISACSIKTMKDYYVLSYLPDPEELSRFKISSLPINARVEVRNFEMNRVYDRNSIVIRESLHKLSFDEKNNWALRPDRALPELLIYHINSAGIFKECGRDFISSKPDYFIAGTINNIEIYNGVNSIQAHLNIIMELKDRNQNVIVSHRIDEKRDIKNYDVTYFVKTSGDIIKKGTHEFLVKIVDYFTKNKGSDY